MDQFRILHQPTPGEAGEPGPADWVALPDHEAALAEARAEVYTLRAAAALGVLVRQMPVGVRLVSSLKSGRPWWMVGQGRTGVLGEGATPDAALVVAARTPEWAAAVELDRQGKGGGG